MTGNARQAVIFKSVLPENLNRQKVGAFGRRGGGEGEARCQDQAPLSPLRQREGVMEPMRHAEGGPQSGASFSAADPLWSVGVGWGGLGPLLARPALLHHSFGICWASSGSPPPPFSPHL